jgi:hypothetical protein
MEKIGQTVDQGDDQQWQDPGANIFNVSFHHLLQFDVGDGQVDEQGDDGKKINQVPAVYETPAHIFKMVLDSNQ